MKSVVPWGASLRTQVLNPSSPYAPRPPGPKCLYTSPMPSVSDRLRAMIGDQGPITFARFMEEALYGEGGYYSRETLNIGVEGDFITGSSYSPLFARATARTLARLGDALGHPADFLEVGYGNGTHLRGLAESSEPTLPGRLMGCDRVQRPLPGRIETVASLDNVKSDQLEGMVFSYELFDALPIHRLIGLGAGKVGELLVAVEADGSFVWKEAGLSDPDLEDLFAGQQGLLEPGQIGDLSPGWRPLYRQMAEKLRRGLLVTCDYGFPRRQLLDRRVRFNGTLACYRRQRVHRNPLIGVGEQDLTAHIDFTALMEEGEAQGLETVALTRQAAWLTSSGIFEGLAEADQKERLEAITLLDPAGMGGEIRVLVQVRDLDVDEILDTSYLL
jgi:SAM-dependent MidA family methyltransferase